MLSSYFWIISKFSSEQASSSPISEFGSRVYKRGKHTHTYTGTKIQFNNVWLIRYFDLNNEIETVITSFPGSKAPYTATAQS